MPDHHQREMPPAARAAQLLAALSDPMTLRVAGWLLAAEPEQRGQVGTCAAELGVDYAAVAKACSRLTACGLLVTNCRHLELRTTTLRAAAANLDAANPVTARLANHPALAPMFSHGRLDRLPVDRALQHEFAEFLAGLFEPNRHYREAEVNATLAVIDSDVAALRRLMIDWQTMRRDQRSVYTRVAAEPTT